MNILSKLILVCSFVLLFLINSSFSKEGENQCSLCQYVAFEASNLGESSKNDQQIIDRLVFLCNGEYGRDRQHPNYPIICSDVATKYGSQLIQLGRKGYGPDASCKNIGICGKPY